MLKTGITGHDFIGRKREASQVNDILKEVSGGRGMVLFISGEAGVGKTRFLEEIRKLENIDKFTILSGKCLYFKDTDTYLPFKEMFQQYKKIKEDFFEGKPIESPFTQGEDEEEGGFGKGYYSELVPMSLIPAEIEAEEIQYHEMDDAPKQMDLLTEFIFNLSSESPLCLFIDDLHWANTNTLELLEYLVREISDEPILIICTYRPEDLFWGEGKAHPLTDTLKGLEREVNYISMKLNRFIELECQEYLKKLLGVDDVPIDFASMIYANTAGNPFFIREMVDSMIENGELDEEDLDVYVAPDRSEALLPTNVKDVVLRRVHWLKPISIKVVRIASVAGLTFTFDVIRDALELREDDVLEALEELIQAKFFIEGGEEEHYRFENPVIRNVIYSELNHSRRKYLHNKLARVQENLYSNDPGWWGDIASNYYKAKDMANSLNYLSKAVSYYKEASPDKAISLLKMIIDCKEKMPISGKFKGENIEVLMDVATLCMKIGDWKHSIEFSKEAGKLSVELGRRDIEVRSLLLQGQLYCKMGEFEESGRSFKAAMNLSGEKDFSWGKSRSAMGLGYLNWRKGNFTKALEYYTVSLQYVKKDGDQSALGTLYVNLGNLSNHKGELDRSMNYYQKALKHLKAAGNRIELARTYQNMGNVLIQKGELTNAHDMIQASMDISDEYGYVNPWALANMIPIQCIEEGQVTARSTYEKVKEQMEDSKDNIGLYIADLYMGICMSRNGDDEGGGSLLKKGYDRLKFNGVKYEIGRAAYYLGDHHMRFDRKEEAMIYLEEAKEIFKSINSSFYLEKVENVIEQNLDQKTAETAS